MAGFLGEVGILELILLALLVAGILVVLYLLSSIVSVLLNRRRGRNVLAAEDLDATSQQAPEEAAPEPEPEPLSERELLAKRESELKKREDRVKSERLRELEQREKMVSSKKSDALFPEDNEFLTPEEKGAGEMEAERKKLLDFISKAEDRYARGEISDQNFRRIVSDYQQQLIELDVKIRKQRGSSLPNL